MVSQVDDEPAIPERLTLRHLGRGGGPRRVGGSATIRRGPPKATLLPPMHVDHDVYWKRRRDLDSEADLPNKEPSSAKTTASIMASIIE